jgi:hypothetical protein
MKQGEEKDKANMENDERLVRQRINQMKKQRM